MKYITNKNIQKATRMIADKGYDWESANDLAIKSFENVKTNGFYHDAEYFIDKILTKEEYERTYNTLGE